VFINVTSFFFKEFPGNLFSLGGQNILKPLFRLKESSFKKKRKDKFWPVYRPAEWIMGPQRPISIDHEWILV